MIRLNIPFTDDRELEEIRHVLESGYLTQGPKVAEFEKKVAEYIGCRYAFAMSSCTTALHLALVVAGIQEGDDVLVADFTFPATGNVIVQQGATPILVDINLETFTMDPNDLRSKVTKHSKAIIAVDAFGCSADMDAIQQIADENNLIVIEDAACAIGTTYKGRYCGNLTPLGCFSFHPRKVITTGEGGMIITNDDVLAEKIKLLRSHGGVRTGGWYQFEEAGFNYRLSDIQGAMGIAQMDKLSLLIERKRLLANELRNRLASIPGIRVPVEPSWGGHIYQSFVILVDAKLNRDQIIADLKELDIESTIGTYALHDQPLYQNRYGYVSGQLPKSHFAFSQTITLPLYPQMESSDIDYIADHVKIAIDKQQNL